MLSRKSAIGTAALIAGTALASAGLALAGGGSSPDPVAFNDAPVAMSKSVSADQMVFPILRRDRTASDVMPSEAIAQVGNPDVGGKNVGLSRAFATPSGTGWVLPGNGSICVAVPDPAAPVAWPTFGLTCNSDKWAEEHGLGILMLDPKTGKGVGTLVLPAGADARIDRDGEVSGLTQTSDGIASVSVVRGDVISVTTPTGEGALPVPPDAR